MKLTELFTATGEPFSYYPGFVGQFDISVNACVMLCFIAWKTFPDELGGWKPMSSETIRKATGLSTKEQVTARKQLVEAGLVEEFYARLDHEMRFKILPKEVSGFSPNPETAFPETPKGSLGNTPKGVSTKGLEGDKKGTRKEGEGAIAPPAVLVATLPEEVAAWNSKANLRKVQAMSTGRTKALKARRSDPYFAANWRTAIDRVAASSFCNGENDRGWKADFDFFIRPDTVVKVMEGKYDNRVQPKKSGFGQFCP